MATTKSDRIRYRYGMCLNEKCDKCKTKEVQQISAHKDFVCAECGKNLRECPPPKPPKPWGLYGGIGAAVIAAGIGAGIYFGGNNTDGNKTGVDSLGADTTIVTPPGTSIVTPDPDSVKQTVKDGGETGKDDTGTTVKTGGGEKKPVNKPQPGVRYQGTIQLAYGQYSGELVDGKPDGAGTLTYTRSHQVVNSKDVTAEKGDRIEGTFQNGQPLLVTLFRTNGETIPVKR